MGNCSVKAVTPAEQELELDSMRMMRYSSGSNRLIVKGSCKTVRVLAPREGGANWKVKLIAINPKELEEIVSKQVSFEELIHQMRMAAVSTPTREKGFFRRLL